MKSRDIVLAALNRQNNDRTPFSWGFGLQPPAQRALDEYLKPYNLDTAELYIRTADMFVCCPDYIAAVNNKDFWGYTYKTSSYGSGSYEEFDYQPLATAENLDDILNYDWPNPDNYDHLYMHKFKRRDPEHNCAWGIRGGNILETFQWLTGLEYSLVLMATEPEMVHAALTKITDFYVTATVTMLKEGGADIDYVFCADDLGGQNGLLFSREMYREIVMPHHKRMFDAIKDYCPHIVYHSDGSVYDILPDVIEAGITCHEAVQIECANMEPEKLAAAFADKIAFHGAVSVQQILPYKQPEEVKAEVRRLKSILGAKGGYICAPSHAIQAGTPPENVVAFCEEGRGEVICNYEL